MKLWVLFPLMASACMGAEIRSMTPVPQSTNTNGWWWGRLRQKDAAVADGGSRIVFLGDSITHGWEAEGRFWWNKYFAGEPYRALNLGFGGDHTENVLWRIRHGQLDGYEARAIVLLIGVNNAWHREEHEEPPIDTILGIKAILNELRRRQPNARIFLHAIFPFGKTADNPVRLRCKRVNKAISRFADGRHIVWVDISDRLTLPNGQIPREVMPDCVHPAGAGREIWAAALIPCINRVLASDATSDLPYQATLPSRLDADMTPAVASVGLSSIPRVEEEWWLNRLRTDRLAALNAPSNGFDTVWVGDTSKPCARAGVHDLDLRYAGDATENVIWRMENGQLEGYRARRFVVKAGHHNSRFDSRSDKAKAVERIVELIKLRHKETLVEVEK